MSTGIQKIFPIGNRYPVGYYRDMAKKPERLGPVEDIATEMERQGLTAYRLAKDAGIPAATLGRILAGERPDPQLSTIVKLAAALGYEVMLAKAR